MKRFIYFTLLCCVAFALGACNHSEELELQNEGEGYIVISTSLAAAEYTRAADNAVERTVNHIDIFVVKSEGADAGDIVHYERNFSGNNSGSAVDGSGSLTLTVRRGDNKFESDEKYTLYLVANATIDQSAAEAFVSLDDLESWLQSDAQLHVTGTKLGGANPPQTFLMQAIAGSVAGQVINNSAGNSEHLTLAATFERAASKIVVNIKQGADVEFYQHLSDGTDKGNALYYFNMLPTKSYVLPTNTVALSAQTLVTTSDLGPNANTYIWSQAAGHTAEAPKHDIQLVGYAYAHDWSSATPLDETCLIVNIPIKWNKDGDVATGVNGKEVTAYNSWYMIPLSEHEKFERNKCYEVNVTINTAGADDRTSVIEMEDIEFNTLEWQDVEISVGDTGNEPQYLTLNKNLVKIFNANMDNTQLSFSSSSPIVSIKLKDIDDVGFPAEYRTDGHRAYYKNKYNAYIDLSGTLLSSISASAEANLLNGKITIISPMVDSHGNENHNNTIRYLEFEVENEQGLKVDFRVEQYPLIYITNEVGWYSYRDDFVTSSYPNPTTYLARNGGIISVGYNGYSGGVIDYTYYSNFGGGGGFWGGTSINGFWGSKVNRDVDGVGSYNDAQTSYDIDYYRWNNNTLAYANQSVGSNARMYHVRVTATSSTYTVGRPKIVDNYGVETTDVENGYTEPSKANARLVSPSFMIASQLGFVEISRISLSANESSFAVARDHCKNYVEVSADGNVYADWRLPTASEIGIILGLQGTSSSDNTKAIDYLLSAGGYFSASGVVTNVNGSSTSAIRCIRDAY